MAHLSIIRDLPCYNSKVKEKGGSSLEVLPASKVPTLQGDIEPQVKEPSMRDILSAGGGITRSTTPTTLNLTNRGSGKNSFCPKLVNGQTWHSYKFSLRPHDLQHLPYELACTHLRGQQITQDRASNRKRVLYLDPWPPSGLPTVMPPHKRTKWEVRPAHYVLEL